MSMTPDTLIGPHCLPLFSLDAISRYLCQLLGGIADLILALSALSLLEVLG